MERTTERGAVYLSAGHNATVNLHPSTSHSASHRSTPDTPGDGKWVVPMYAFKVFE